MSEKLSKKQNVTICHILSTKSLIEAARKSKINRKTIYRWMDKPEFKKELEKRKSQIVQGAYDELYLLMSSSIQKMKEMLESENQYIALNSAKSILKSIIDIKRIEEIESKISAIEVLMLERKEHEL